MSMAIAILILVGLFFYRLNVNPLTSYDEAWYAEIARNITLTKNPLHLIFNGATFTDHPPFGFMMMAFPTWVLGSNEFSARFISAILGIGTVMLIYFIGKKLKDSKTGFISAVVLLSSMWFMFRARSGNLDIPFMFWEVMTVWLLLQKGRKFIYFSFVSFALLFLTKTLVGLGILPVYVYLLWIRKDELDKKIMFKSVLLWLVIVLPWYVYNQLLNPWFLQHHFIEIGTRSENNLLTIESVRSKLFYLQIGIGRWYKVFLLSGIFGIFSLIKNFKSGNNWGLLTLWFLGFSVFLFSSKTEIWHLLPLYPVVALIISIALVEMSELFFPKLSIIRSGVLLGCLALSIFQFYQFSNLIYPGKYVYSTEKDILVKAGKYQNLYLMDTFYPSAVYYSGQKINYLYLNQNAYGKMVEILMAGDSAVFIVNNETKNRLEKDGVKFLILEKNDSYYLVSSVKL